MDAGKPHSLQKYGIRPSAFAVSRDSTAFTARLLSSGSYYSHSCLPACIFVNARLGFERCRLSDHLPVHSQHSHRRSFWNKYAPSLFPTVQHLHCVFFIRFIREWNAETRWESEQIHRELENSALWFRLEDAAQGISPEQHGGLKLSECMAELF